MDTQVYKNKDSTIHHGEWVGIHSLLLLSNMIHVTILYSPYNYSYSPSPVILIPLVTSGLFTVQPEVYKYHNQWELCKQEVKEWTLLLQWVDT